MNYDNYNFEEAYKEQVNKLEEYELERLLRESKVKCLYRTTTTKSKNIKTGKTLLEAQIYPSFKCYKDVPKVKIKKSKEAQRNLNDKNSRRRFIRLAMINFSDGDYWATYGWDKEHMPATDEELHKDIKNYFERIKYRIRKRKLPELKYMCIIAFDEYTRPHVHILMSNSGISRDELEDLWTKCKRKNTRKIAMDENMIIGLAEYVSRNTKGTKRWISSKNLKRPPKPDRSYSKFRKRRVNKMVKDFENLKFEVEKEYKGYRFLDAERYYNEKNGTFYLYIRMIRD